jgi:hypothetical protein
VQNQEEHAYFQSQDKTEGGSKEAESGKAMTGLAGREGHASVTDPLRIDRLFLLA